MQNKISKLFLFSAMFLMLPNFAKAAPLITGAMINDGMLDIEGVGFGTKTNAEPIKWTTADEPVDIFGQVPSGWFAGGTSIGGTINTTRAYSGNNSVLFDYTGATSADIFRRNVYDLGTNVNLDKLYISSWVYLDEAPSNAQSFNWKSLVISSASNYYWCSGVDQTSTGFAGFYGRDIGWFNVALTQYHDNCIITSGSHSGWPSDAFLFGQWQRIEWLWTASDDMTHNGTMKVIRIGRAGGPMINGTGLTTHDANDSRWRYIGFGQGITNVIEGYNFLTSSAGYTPGNDVDAPVRVKTSFPHSWSTGQIVKIADITSPASINGFHAITVIDSYTFDIDGYFDSTPRVGYGRAFVQEGLTENLKVFYDNIYIDNSWARVEIGDNAVYENCTHREIQPTTIWDADGNIISATLNQGSFADGTSVYLYVVDENGVASAGFPITFATSGDVTAPSAPSGLGVI